MRQVVAIHQHLRDKRRLSGRGSRGVTERDAEEGFFFFPLCEAGHDEIDAVSPRLHQPHGGEDGYVEDEGGERRGIFLHPQAPTST